MIKYETKIESNMERTPQVKHPIQQIIIEQLIDAEYKRFKDIRPADVDTNLLSYHLASLVKSGYVQKSTQGYTLSPRGLAHCARTKSGTPEGSPQIQVMIVVQNSEGDVLLHLRDRQPFINRWTLPAVSLSNGDASVLEATFRAAFDLLGLENPDLERAGDCYVRVSSDGLVISNTLIHVSRLYTDMITERTDLRWARPHKLHELRLAPAAEEIITRTFFKDPTYFEEFTVEYRSPSS